MHQWQTCVVFCKALWCCWLLVTVDCCWWWCVALAWWWFPVARAEISRLNVCWALLLLSFCFTSLAALPDPPLALALETTVAAALLAWLAPAAPLLLPPRWGLVVVVECGYATDTWGSDVGKRFVNTQYLARLTEEAAARATAEPTRRSAVECGLPPTFAKLEAVLAAPAVYWRPLWTAFTSYIS